MKPLISRLSGHTTLFFFPLLVFSRSKWKKYIILLFSVIMLVGCFRSFYRTGTTEKIDSNRLEQLKASNKYFIIHYRDSVLGLYDVAISNQVLTGKSRQLLSDHSRELNPDVYKGNPVKKANMSTVLSEVHLYVNKDKTAVAYEKLEIPLPEIYRMDIYEFDEKSTKASTTWSIVGIAATVAVAAVIIAVAATAGPDLSSGDEASCGCPQVYIEQKGDFAFQNGIFSGAVYSNLERKDYLPLDQPQTENSTVKLRITGHDNEVQFLNSVQLIGVPHPANSKILADRYGKLFSTNKPIQAETATAQHQKDLREILAKPDGNSFAFNSAESNVDYSHAYLTFKMPKEQGNAKLVIRARNSNWSAMLYQEYNLLFGEDYFRYRDHQEKTNPKKMEDLVLRQGLPIKVFVENGNEWEYAGYFPLSGTEGYRDMIMEITVPDNKAEQVRIKLETVYRFWDLDYAAMDFSEDAPLQPVLLDFISALHNTSGDQKVELTATDRAYTKLDKDQSVDLTFGLPGQYEDQHISFFLVSSGYYHIQDAYPVHSNARRLKAFKNPAEFDRFSKEKYLEMGQWQALVNSKSSSE